MSYKTLGVVTVTKIGTKFENNKKKDKKSVLVTVTAIRTCGW